MLYKNYLTSKHWRDKRKSVFSKKGYSCSICFSTQELHVHHRFYRSKGKSILGIEKTGSLEPLCGRCHLLLHKYHGFNFLRKSFFFRAKNAVLMGIPVDEAIRFSFSRGYYFLMVNSFKKQRRLDHIL